MRCLSQETVVTRVNNSASAAQTAINTSILDMSGFDAVAFEVLLGTVTDACVFTATVMENSASSTSGAAAVTGAQITFTASTSSNLVLLLDVIRPKLRYVYVNITRTTQNAGVDGVVATQYRDRVIPTTQPATTTSVISTPEV